MCEAFALDRDTAEFLAELLRKGPRRICVQKPDSRCTAIFGFSPIANPPTPPIALDLPRRSCVPVGGGKDSIVTLECLKRAGEPLVLFALGDAEPIAACIAAIRTAVHPGASPARPRLVPTQRRGRAERPCPDHRDPERHRSGRRGAVLAATRSRCRTSTPPAPPTLRPTASRSIISSANPWSSNGDFAEYVAGHISPSLAYFSLLRPLSEIEIARRFAQLSGLFSDLSQLQHRLPADAPDERGQAWCGDCPKCRFVFLALGPVSSPRPS